MLWLSTEEPQKHYRDVFGQKRITDRDTTCFWYCTKSTKQDKET